ncbi:hypothetical protein Q9966_003394 [Columba livia]|nr:hypothetical protein Q9966_003394 [Columba livia]
MPNLGVWKKKHVVPLWLSLIKEDKNIDVKEPIVKEEGKKVIHNSCLLCRHFNRIDASQQLMIRVVF